MADVAGATVRGWLGSLSDSEIVAKLADLDSGGGSTSVAWDDVTDKPTTFPAAPPAWDDVTDKPSTFPAAPPEWSSITGKPSTFPADPPAWGDISGKPDVVTTARKVNGHPLSADVSVTGADTSLVGYAIGTVALAAVSGTDSVNDAIAKLEKRIADLEAAGGAG